MEILRRGSACALVHARVFLLRVGRQLAGPGGAGPYRDITLGSSVEDREARTEIGAHCLHSLFNASGSRERRAIAAAH
jgi:hypothetical protein